MYLERLHKIELAEFTHLLKFIGRSRSMEQKEQGEMSQLRKEKLTGDLLKNATFTKLIIPNHNQYPGIVALNT